MNHFDPQQAELLVLVYQCKSGGGDVQQDPAAPSPLPELEACSGTLQVIRIFEQREPRVAFENTEAVREPGILVDSELLCLRGYCQEMSHHTCKRSIQHSRMPKLECPLTRGVEPNARESTGNPEKSNSRELVHFEDSSLLQRLVFMSCWCTAMR